MIRICRDRRPRAQTLQAPYFVGWRICVNEIPRMRDFHGRGRSVLEECRMQGVSSNPSLGAFSTGGWWRRTTTDCWCVADAVSHCYLPWCLNMLERRRFASCAVASTSWYGRIEKPANVMVLGIACCPLPIAFRWWYRTNRLIWVKFSTRTHFRMCNVIVLWPYVQAMYCKCDQCQCSWIPGYKELDAVSCSL